MTNYQLDSAKQALESVTAVSTGISIASLLILIGLLVVAVILIIWFYNMYKDIKLIRQNYVGLITRDEPNDGVKISADRIFEKSELSNIKVSPEEIEEITGKSKIQKEKK